MIQGASGIAQGTCLDPDCDCYHLYLIDKSGEPYAMVSLPPADIECLIAEFSEHLKKIFSEKQTQQ